jgi:enoyl-[acyl-carrier protein] reductase/trans-2-enoyl-CoA reductase (NAD+)
VHHHAPRRLRRERAPPDRLRAERDTLGPIDGGPKRVLVIGASTGYGLASRIVAAFGCGAETLGIFFEKEGTRAQAGHRRLVQRRGLPQAAEEAGLYARSINGDAFSDEVKARAIEEIRAHMGQVDLVVYSLAAPRRQHPRTARCTARR